MRVGDEGSLAVPSRVEAEGAHKTAGRARIGIEVDLEGSHDRSDAVLQRCGQSHRRHLLDHYGGRRNPEPRHRRSHLRRRHSALHPDRHPVPGFVRVHRYGAPHRQRRAGRPTLPAFQRSPIVVRPAHPKRAGPESLLGEPGPQGTLHLRPRRHVPEVDRRNTFPIEEEAAESRDVADEGDGIVGLLEWVEADLVVGCRRGLGGVGAGVEENRSGDQAHE